VGGAQSSNTTLLKKGKLGVFADENVDKTELSALLSAIKVK
jgi:hypothetical protein